MWLESGAGAQGLTRSTERSRQTRPRVSRKLAAIGILLGAIIVAALCAIVLDLRTEAEGDARRELTTLDTVLAEETARAMQGVDLVLRNVIGSFGSDGGPTPDDLRAKIAGIAQLDAVSIVGADGRLITSSRFFPVPGIDLSDRDDVVRLRDAPVAEPFVTEPVQNRATGTWTISLARRLTGADGRFAGLVLGAIDLRYFDTFYRSLELGRRSAISLWRQDGTLLTRAPALPGIGRPFKAEPFDPAFIAGRGGYREVADSVDGTTRFVATRAVPGYPLVIEVSRTRDEVLHQWRRQASFGAVATALFVGAILMILHTLARRSQVDMDRAEAVLEREDAVAARKAAEAQLRQSQKMEAMGQLTGGIAHDFNNLLNVVMVNLDWIERHLQDDGKLLARVHDAISAAERAAETTHKLLTFARSQPPSLTSIDVNDVIRNFIRLLSNTLGGQINLHLDLAAELPPLSTDSNQFENALLNLAVNARDAMPEGGSLTIATYALPPEMGAASHRIVIDVTDTGPGMTDEVIARAFEPFFTTKPVGKGTGLGLNQVLRFVEQADGTATITSRPGEGTTVSLVFPVHDPATSRLAA